MATVETNHLPDLALYVIRPALAEARLMTEKHARDAVYVVMLTKELRNIEMKVAAMEEALQLRPEAAATEHLPHIPEDCECVGRRAPESQADADWIRAKSSELNRRLRRIEQLSGKR